MTSPKQPSNGTRTYMTNGDYIKYDAFMISNDKFIQYLKMEQK